MGKLYHVGVLALQGDFAEHAKRLEALGCSTAELRCAEDITKDLDAIVLPGGESTVQAKLLDECAMREPLKALIEAGMPVLGTCAGLVLLAEQVEHGNGERTTHDQAEPQQADVTPGTFGTLPVRVRRNAYGRQLASFHANAQLRSTGKMMQEAPIIPLTFIRAPQIAAVGEDVEVLVSYEDQPVAVRFGNQIGITFHPELDQDDTLYRLFLDLIRDSKTTH